MTHKTFSIEEAIKTGWKLTKENFWFLAGLFLFALFISTGMHMVPGLSFIIGLFVGISIITAGLEMYAGKKVTVKDLFAKYDRVFEYLVATVLYMALVIVGLLLLIVPGVYFAVKYQFYKFIVLEKDVNPLEALRESGRITEGHWWKLFGFFWILAAINIIGALLLGVGLIVSVPVSLFAAIFVYKKLVAKHHRSAVAS